MPKGLIKFKYEIIMKRNGFQTELDEFTTKRKAEKAFKEYCNVIEVSAPNDSYTLELKEEGKTIQTKTIGGKTNGNE